MAPPTTLVDAINSAVPDRLRKTLMAVIDDPSGRAIVENQLLQPVDASSTTTIPTKRKKYEICGQCNKEFDATENANDACVWHGGLSFRCGLSRVI